MGGAGPDPNQKGGKKALDAAINLVPYIDLLMTIMTFLMMTAVWTQIAMLEVQNASGGPDDQQQEPDPTKPKPILVLVSDKFVKVQEEQNPDMKEFPATGEGYDFTAISVELKRFKDLRPERTEIKIQSEDGVRYEHLAKIIDISTGLKYPALTLTPVGGQ